MIDTNIQYLKEKGRIPSQMCEGDQLNRPKYQWNSCKPEVSYGVTAEFDERPARCK